MSKHDTGTLQTLIEMADRESDQAAEALAEANRNLADSEKSLNLLLDYRSDYLGQLERNTQNGLHAGSFMNFRTFLAKLDQAIVGQQAVVSACRQKVAERRKQWQECERKKLSYGVLVTKAETREQRAQLRREQKLMDEHAQRLSLKKTHPC
ncbi:MAG TPA: flagellar export protein FliJ [Methylophilaceae bacterium]|jgi:flagellar FliJ protein